MMALAWFVIGALAGWIGACAVLGGFRDDRLELPRSKKKGR